MLAVIMAGGEGSRLRPLTCDIPKPMARLCGRPVLEYILDLLREHGFTQASVTIRYLPERISGHFPDGIYRDMNLNFVMEDSPLGTAGSVKNACGNTSGDVLVISGDAMCDFDLTAAMEFHKNSSAHATILAKKVSDPREYGLIDAEPGGAISAFIEKPAFSQAISDLANTGIYILSGEALKLIPAGTSYDFAKDLFPLMLSKGMKLMCREDTGYWCDIGDLESYISCQRDMLSGKVRCHIRGARDAAGNIFAGVPPENIGALIEPPVYIGKNVRVENGARLEGPCVIDDGCYIGPDSRITQSIVLQDSSISARASLTGSLICAGAAVKNGAMLFECATVGAKSVVGERSTIHAGVKIWNQKNVADGAIVTEHLKTGNATRGYFDDDGMTGQIGVELTPEFMSRLGCAIGSVAPNARIAVGCGVEPGATVLKAALCAGIRSTGASVMDFGENFKAQFAFSMNFCTVPLGVFIRGGTRAGVRIFTMGGLPANRETERNIEIILSRGEFVRCAPEDMGDAVEMGAMGTLYRSHLIRYAPKGLAGCRATINSRSLAVQNTLRETLYKLGCDVSDGGITLELSSQGDKLRVHSDETGYIPHHKILSWCAVHELERGHDVAVPFDAPELLDMVAANKGRRLLRYFNCPADHSDDDARKLAAYQMWTQDGLMQAVMLLGMVRQAGGPGALTRTLPNFGMATLTLDTKVNPAGLIRRLNSEKSGAVTEGVRVRAKSGVVLVKPLKRGTGIKIMAEAINAEIASELCAEMEVLLRQSEITESENGHTGNR